MIGREITMTNPGDMLTDPAVNWLLTVKKWLKFFLLKRLVLLALTHKTLMDLFISWLVAFCYSHCKSSHCGQTKTLKVMRDIFWSSIDQTLDWQMSETMVTLMDSCFLIAVPVVSGCGPSLPHFTVYWSGLPWLPRSFNPTLFLAFGSFL